MNAMDDVDDVLVLVTRIADYGENLGGPIFMFHIRTRIFGSAIYET
jgi:hypothetical protein